MILTNIFCANVFINKSALFIRKSVFLVDFQTHSYPTKNKDYLIASTVPRRTFNIHRTFSKWNNVLNKTSLEGSFWNQKWFFYALLQKYPSLFVRVR